MKSVNRLTEYCTGIKKNSKLNFQTYQKKMNSHQLSIDDGLTNSILVEEKIK
jgi:hypothetical protein